MADTAIDDPEAYFQVKIYTGNDTNDTAITLDGDTNMQPALVWIKSRDNTEEHMMTDSVRPINNYLASDNDGVEDSDSDNMQSLDSDGFTMGVRDTHNSNAIKYVAWCWKESATSGFDIVGYTGDGVIGTTVAHSLSAKPEFIMIKARAGTNAENNWYCWHVGLAANKNMSLNTTAAEFTDPGSGIINTTQNTSTFGFYSSDSSGIVNVNEDSTTFIAYLFAGKQGFSKFGSYTGNGNADGTFVYLGFKPAFMLAKRTDANDHWTLWDNKRESNPNNNVLYPSLSDAESTSDSSYPADLVSNGVKWRGTSTGMNASGANYIYMAFAEAPFVNSKGVPCNAK